MRNFETLAHLITENDIHCEWEQMPGACHAFYSEHYWKEAKAEATELALLSPKLAELVEIIEDKDRLSELRVPTAIGVLLQAIIAKFAPYKLVTWILKDLLSHSKINLQTKTRTTSISRITSKQWLVSTDRGAVRTPRVLLATNAYTGQLLPCFRSLIVPVQGQMAALRPLPGFRPLNYTYCFFGLLNQDRMQDDYLIQRDTVTGTQLIFGGGRGCAKMAGVGLHTDDSVDEEAAKYLRNTLKHVLDADKRAADTDLADNGKVILDNKQPFQADAEWTGTMGFSRDGYPWVGAVPHMEGVWLCGGYTGHGKFLRTYCMTSTMKTAYHK
jgi:glycine/D-amino acid oxidase-like deaminating enzyme